MLKCLEVSSNYWNFVRLQGAAEDMWKKRQEKLDMKENVLKEDIELVRLSAELKQRLLLCTSSEQYTLRQRQKDQLNFLLFQFNIDVKYCNCAANVRRYLVLILLEVFNFSSIGLEFPDEVITLFQGVYKNFYGAESQEMELIRKEQSKALWKY
jgi:hypothetical protein